MSQITQLASRLFAPASSPTHFTPLRTLPTSKRIRGYLNTHLVFDTTAALLVWEHAYFPYYWIPHSDFAAQTAVFTKDAPLSGIESSTFSLTTPAGTNEASKELKALLVPTAFNSPLAGYVKLDFTQLDRVFEELEEAKYHPKDPYHRVDLLATGRHVKVEVEGTVVADTAGEGGVVGLWETGFPARWYLPGTAIRWEFLSKSDTTTGCPYKGQASYYDATVAGKTVKDVVWYYENPTQESSGIKGLYCFYPDKVRTWVDGKEIERIGMPAKPTLDKEGKRMAAEEKKEVKEGAAAPAAAEAGTDVNGDGYKGKSCDC